MSAVPDGVERALIERKQPAGCDLPIADVVQTHSGPAMVDAANRGEPFGERGESVAVADQNVQSLHLKRVVGEISSSSEVAEHLLETTVGPRDAIVTGDGPRDVRSQELLERGLGATCVELVLRSVQSVEKTDGSVPVHPWRWRRSEPLARPRTYRTTC
jgi:hypothetical protein